MALWQQGILHVLRIWRPGFWDVCMPGCWQDDKGLEAGGAMESEAMQIDLMQPFLCQQAPPSTIPLSLKE